MKKLVYLLLILSFTVMSCNKPNNQEEQEQDYTSFVVVIDASNDFRSCVAGYFGEDGLCHKIGDLGNLGGGKVSPEIILSDESICEHEIFIFYDLYDDAGVFHLTGMFDKTFNLKKKEKNHLMADGYGSRVDKNDPLQYPH